MNAIYGTAKTFIDVTQIVTGAFIVEDCLKVPNSVSFNELFGDVAPNEPKNLTVTNRGVKMIFPEIRNADYCMRIGYSGSQKYWNLPAETQVVDTETQKTHFLTFGNERFTKSVARICDEARQSGFFDGNVEGLSQVDDEFKSKFKNILARPRGGGYWIWKPHIISQALQRIADNDILVYCDAGCTVNKKGMQKWCNLKKTVNGSKYGIIGFELTHKEAKYTNEKVFEHFRIPLDDTHVRQSSQIMASIIIIRKCPYSQALIQEWLDTLNVNAELFTDHYNGYQKTTLFHDHRHDQSVLSVLRKIRGCALIPDDTFAHDWTTIADVPFLTTRIRE